MEDPKNKYTALSNNEVLANKPTTSQQVRKPKPFPVKKVVMVTGSLLLALLVGLIVLAVYIGGKVEEKKQADLVGYLKCEPVGSQPISKKFDSTLVTDDAKVTVHEVIYNVSSDDDYVSGSKSNPDFGCKKGVFVNVSITARDDYLSMYDFRSALRVANRSAKKAYFDFDKYVNAHNLRILDSGTLEQGRVTMGWFMYNLDLKSDNKNLTFEVPGDAIDGQQKSIDVSLQD